MNILFVLCECMCIYVCVLGCILLTGYNVELIVKKDHVLEMMNLVSAQLTGAVKTF